MRYWQIVCYGADDWAVFDGGEQAYTTDTFGGAARFVQDRATDGDEVYVNTFYREDALDNDWD